jgi:hypothetical protein
VHKVINLINFALIQNVMELKIIQIIQILKIQIISFAKNQNVLPVQIFIYNVNVPQFNLS